MPDTIRSRSELIALLADNTTGKISPQDLRDVLVSLHGVYGSVYTDAGAAPQTVNITASKLAQFAANGEAAGVTPIHTNDEVQALTAGVYRVNCQLSFTGTASRTYRAQLRNGGAAVNGASARAKVTTASDVETMQFVTFVTCAANDLLSVYLDADVDGSSFTLIDGQLSIQRVA